MNLRDNPHKISRFSQSYLLPLLSFPLFNLFFKMRILGKEKLRNLKSPYIIVSNHIAFYDSFAFRLFLKINQLPIRFMAVKRFDDGFVNILRRFGIVSFVYTIFGVFVVEQGRGIDKNLEEAIRIIQNGGNVVMYPEGSMSKDGCLKDFKLGAGVLIKRTGVPVLPVSMRLRKGKYFRKKFVLNIGEIMHFDTKKTPEEITLELFKEISILQNAE